MSSVRVRIAPSPSGFLHIGTAKMALMNWLFARQQGGTFILRLEDTDAERTDEAFVQAMCDGFTWLGIDWDEGPAFGGEPEKGAYGPYRQSRRRDIHHAAGMRLVEEGTAYKCFCTKEELVSEREKSRMDDRAPRYSGKCRSLTPEAIAAKGNAPFVVRFKVPEGSTVVDDIVQGRIEVQNKEFDDFVILKPNGDPIFHLAVVVDDGEMGVTHIIRGDDHLTNASRHVMLFNALGYPLPVMAHLPMVLDERGKKYSKRMHGANVLDWRKDGYLPEALVNYVALLGWNPGDEREVFTRAELLGAFSIKRLGQSAATFDVKRLTWLNGQHIRMLSIEDLTDRILPKLEDLGFDYSGKSRDWLLRLTEICQEKLTTLNDIERLADFFFIEPHNYEEKAVRKQWVKPDAADRLTQIRDTMASLEPWSIDAFRTAYNSMAESSGVSLGPYIHPTRLALTGKSVGPGLFELAELLGKDACIARIERAIEYVQRLD